MAITGIVMVVESGVSPLEAAIAISTIVCSYVVAETARPSGGNNGSDS
jgi:hypothetical protein